MKEKQPLFSYYLSKSTLSVTSVTALPEGEPKSLLF